jgi:hypothetical protein
MYRHLHLHVISSDLTAPALKTKRHYNSFSPRTGFFIPLVDVLRGWFDHDDSASPSPLHQQQKQQQQESLMEQFAKVRRVAFSVRVLRSIWLVDDCIVWCPRRQVRCRV